MGGSGDAGPGSRLRPEPWISKSQPMRVTIPAARFPPNAQEIANALPAD